MILDLHRQRAQEAIRAAAPEAPKEPTLSENLQDAKKSVLLGRMLELEGITGIKLAKRLKNPGPDDIAEFAKRNDIFNEKMRAAKDMGEAITKDELLQLAKDVPFLQDQLKIMSADQLAQIFKNQLPLIAISDEGRFNNIKGAFEAMKSYREGGYKNLDQMVTKICTDNQFDQERFVAIMRNPDPTQRVELLREEIKSAFGFKNLVTGGRYALIKARALENGGALKASIDGAMKEIDDKMKDIGSVLGLTIEENDDVRQAFMAEALGDRADVKPEQTFKNMRSEMKTEKDVKEAWETEKNTPEYKALTDDVEKQKYLDDWTTHQQDLQEETAKEKGGFWSQIGLALYKMLFSNAKLEK